jgi:hypothetical protein
MESPSKDRQSLPSLGGTLGFGEVAEEPMCTVCNKHFATQALYDSHLPGHTHRTRLQQLGVGGLFGCAPLYQHIGTLLEPVQPRETE